MQRTIYNYCLLISDTDFALFYSNMNEFHFPRIRFWESNRQTVFINVIIIKNYYDQSHKWLEF